MEVLAQERQQRGCWSGQNSQERGSGGFPNSRSRPSLGDRLCTALAGRREALGPFPALLPAPGFFATTAATAHQGPPEFPTWFLVEDAPDVELDDELDHDLAGRSEELEEDLLEDLEADEELEEDLDEEHEADEDETSACAPT